jgi:hypothetical protein
MRKKISMNCKKEPQACALRSHVCVSLFNLDPASTSTGRRQGDTRVEGGHTFNDDAAIQGGKAGLGKHACNAEEQQSNTKHLVVGVSKIKLRQPLFSIFTLNSRREV